MYSKMAKFGARLRRLEEASSCAGRLRGGVQGQLGMSQKPLPPFAFFLNNECIVYGENRHPKSVDRPHH